jgi:hypothetical protein
MEKRDWGLAPRKRRCDYGDLPKPMAECAEPAEPISNGRGELPARTFIFALLIVLWISVEIEREE